MRMVSMTAPWADQAFFREATAIIPEQKGEHG
jgi:hypothetical protein